METMKVAVVLALVSLGLVASQSVMVELEPVDFVSVGPFPMSVLYAEGQNMTFNCTATPLSETVDWLLGIENSPLTAAGAVSLANSSPRVVANVASNNDNPSSITILNAMLQDSGTNVTCKDGAVNAVTDTVTILVEGIPPCPNVTLVGTTESSIYLSWVPTGLLPTTQYVITMDPDINSTIITTATSFRFTDLNPLTDYSINVSACNEVGCNDNCSIVYTTGAILDEDMVSVCSTGGSNPSVTVFMQYNSSMNSSFTGFVVSISRSSLTKSVDVDGDGIYSAYFEGVALSSTYTISVQPFNGPSRGNVISREITIRSVISLTPSLNYGFTCVDTCVGPLSILSCGTTVTCGTASPLVVYTDVGSTSYVTVPECVMCTAPTVAQIIDREQNITQMNTLSRIGDNCDDINECVESNPCDQICTNNEGSYICSCKDGYEFKEDDPKCHDIDECEREHQCTQNCQNTPGGHYCYCDPGYLLAKNDLDCEKFELTKALNTSTLPVNLDFLNTIKDGLKKCIAGSICMCINNIFTELSKLGFTQGAVQTTGQAFSIVLSTDEQQAISDLILAVFGSDSTIVLPIVANVKELGYNCTNHELLVDTFQAGGELTIFPNIMTLSMVSLHVRVSSVTSSPKLESLLLKGTFGFGTVSLDTFVETNDPDLWTFGATLAIGGNTEIKVIELISSAIGVDIPSEPFGNLLSQTINDLSLKGFVDIVANFEFLLVLQGTIHTSTWYEETVCVIVLQGLSDASRIPPQLGFISGCTEAKGLPATMYKRPF